MPYRIALAAALITIACQLNAGTRATKLPDFPDAVAAGNWVVKKMSCKEYLLAAEETDLERKGADFGRETPASTIYAIAQAFVIGRGIGDPGRLRDYIPAYTETCRAMPTFPFALAGAFIR